MSNSIDQLFLKLPLESHTVDESTGFLICAGVGARTGVQPYKGEEIGKVGDAEFHFVYRGIEFIKQLEEQFREATKPLTDDHHTIKVTATSAENLDKIVGWVNKCECVVQGKNAYLAISVVITDPELIARIQAGEEHIGLSVGYTVPPLKAVKPTEWVDADGVVGDPGTAYIYTLEMVNPAVNHLAICQMGRAGASTKLFLDSLESLKVSCDSSSTRNAVRSEYYNSEEASKEEAISFFNAPAPLGDAYRLYPYPNKTGQHNIMDEQQYADMMAKVNDAVQKCMSDAIGKGFKDGINKAMCDALENPNFTQKLYGAFQAQDLVSAIRAMFEHDKGSENAADKATQANITNAVTSNGFYKDSAEFGREIVAAMQVWKEVGPEIADSTNEAMSATALKAAYLTKKGVEVKDSFNEETINELYKVLRDNMPAKQQQAVSPMKSLFDSMSNPAPQANSTLPIVDGMTITQLGNGAVVYQ
jgi:Uncharacterized protein conserved in bacteria (DUF2213)